MSKKEKKTKKRIRDPRSPQLFSNAELGLPPEEMEYRGTKIVVNKHGKRVRQAVITSTKEQYVQQANEVWHGCYDYTDSVYEDKLKPIVIYCPKHELHFTVAMAQNHIKKHNATGCPVCAAEKRHGREYGPDWRDYLKLSQNSNRVGVIRPEYIPKTEEQLERERIKLENKEERRLQREREQQELMAKYGAKTVPEARFIERVHEKYPDLDTALVDYKDRETDVTLICPIHGMFEITPRILFNGAKGHLPHGCWQCEGLEDPHTKYRLTASEFYRRVSGRYGTKLTFQRKRKLTMQTKITATCYRHGSLTHDVQWWLSGKGCEYCNGKVYYPHWKDYARQVHGDKYEYVGDAPTRIDDLLHYICPEHGLIEQRFDVHVSQGCGCPKCANYPNKKSPEQRCQEWIEKSDEKYRGEFDYSEATADYVNNDSKVWLTHKPCGTRFQITPDTHLRGVNGGCPVCNARFLESEGERTVRLWLEDHHIDHDTQHKLPNEDPTLPLQYLKTDFWIDDFDGQPLVIEYNGKQHYEYSPYYHKGRRDFEVQQHRDRYLRRYCRAQGYRLLEIPYWEFDHIDSILTSVLLDHEPIPTFEPPSTPDTQQAPTEA